MDFYIKRRFFRRGLLSENQLDYSLIEWGQMSLQIIEKGPKRQERPSAHENRSIDALRKSV